MNPNSRYQNLLQKYLSNTCSAEEAAELFHYLRNNRDGRVLLQSLSDEYRQALQNDMLLPSQVSNRVWNRLEESISSAQPAVVPLYQPFRKWLAIAAVLLVVLSVGAYFIAYQRASSHNTISRINAIKPGSNKAYLTLANGRTILLDDKPQGYLARQQGATIHKDKNGLVVYHFTGSKVASVQTNTIATPKGGQYQVVLPDGTRVWLNAASSLTFPTAFIGKERQVVLNGEAYFEVAKNKAMPFKVAANNVTVQVLGTHFNVMAYDDEKLVSATLLEGAVKLHSGQDDVLLKPGHQARFNKTEQSFKVVEVDTEEAIAWKNGYFMFNNENIYSVMRKLSRWYNVEVSFQEDLSKKTLWGTVSRFEDVSQVLKMLELTGTVHFKVEGRRITVMQ
ncbi:DUF4974 domain-containing protein [Mucilaginibacter sp. Bleaf8]|uniref:FecR family protein n=1 Tax=Mucilaginibacter sp. Bleaf8 TaxID=2834430 RepID=UPI001BCD4AF2|nr:FecR family protein [Mucilaginibacter sp. Bleaf8]MBS7564101.1 DUF4974 domain-containing protein [Mucilaginibacter sp. Bleaf8]